MLRRRFSRGVKDRRGAGIAEYALLLFIVLVVGAVTFKFLGGRVKHAGGKTEEQFAAQGGGKGGNGKGGGGSGQGQGDQSGQGAGDNNGQGGSGGGGGGGGSAGGGGGGGANGQNAPDPHAVDDTEEQGRGIPLWKIIGGVFVILFAIGGYFAFRKQKSSG